VEDTKRNRKKSVGKEKKGEDGLDSLSGMDFSETGQLMSGVELPKTGAKGVLLDRMNGGGLQIDYEFSRQASLYSSKMNTVNLTLINKTSNTLNAIAIADVKGVEMRKFDEVARLLPGMEHATKIYVDFAAKTTPIKFNIRVGDKEFPVKLAPQVGELLRPHAVSHEDFQTNQSKLSGMNETVVSTECSDVNTIAQKVVRSISAAPLTQHLPNVYRFSGKKLADSHILLIEITTTPNDIGSGGVVKIRVNCDDFMFSGQLVDAIKKSLT